MTGEPSRRKRGRPPHPDILTPREWQVLDLIRQSLTNEQIAHRLDISPATAKYHVSEILSKLGVTTREEAAAWGPEAVPTRRWWAISPEALRRLWPLGAAGAGLAGIVAVGLVTWQALRASGEDEPTIRSDTSPSASASPFAVATAPPQATADGGLPPPRRLVFQPGETGRYTRGLYERSGDGVITLLVENPDFARNGGTFAVSNDRRWLAFAYRGTVYLRDRAASEAPRPVASLDHVWNIALSPDARRAVVSARPDGIEGTFLIDMASGSVTRFEPEGHRPSDPVWSPDGNWIAFWEGFCDSPATYLVAPDGTNLRKLADHRAQIAWSPDGSHLALADYCHVSPGIWLIDLNANLTQLSSTVPSYVPRIAWSTDGRRLTFVASVQTDASPGLQIRAIEIENRREWAVSDGAQQAWAPDGSALTFARDGHLYIANLDGSSQRQVAFPAQPAITMPTWLADGSLIFAYLPPTNAAIYVRDIETGSDIDVADGYGPVWSPDGSAIAFIGGGTGAGLGGRSDVYAMQANGGSVRKVGQYNWDDVGGPCENATHVWSPDGDSLAYDNEGTIRIVDAQSGTLVGSVEDAYEPEWSPQGDRVVHTSFGDTGQCRVATTLVSSGQRAELTDGQSPKFSPDGRHIAFVRQSYPETRAFIVRSDGSGERQISPPCSYASCSISLYGWSPDSSRILMSVHGYHANSVYSGSTEVVIWDMEDDSFAVVGSGYNADWSPDGNRVVFQVGTSEVDARLFIAPADGSGEPQFLSDGHAPQWSPDGTRITFARGKP